MTGAERNALEGVVEMERQRLAKRAAERLGLLKSAPSEPRGVPFHKSADRDPGSPEAWDARRDATRKAVDALAASKAAAEGLSFEKAYDAVLRAAPELAEAVI